MRIKNKFIILFALVSAFSFSQSKDEQEQRIDLEQFPKEAQLLLKDLPNDSKKLKFYRETDSLKVSYEAKFKYKKRFFSVEFDNTGKLEDIEVIIKNKKLDKTLLEALTNFYNTNYKSFKFIKIQQQYVPKYNPTNALILELLNGNSSSYKTNYEIIAEVKSNSKREIREFTFDDKGQLIRSRPLKPSSYEHIMY